MYVENKHLLFTLCQPNCIINERDKIVALLNNEYIIGVIITNRVGGIVYENLKNNDILQFLPREVSNALRDISVLNTSKNRSYFQCVNYVYKIAEEIKSRYAMLKGAFLCDFYPYGCRTSNDIDLLVSQEDIGAISEILFKNGFVQGYVRNDNFKVASRKEVITSRIMRGETVPFVKEVDLPFMKYLEIDINFSIDYKNTNSNVVEKMISNSVCYSSNDLNLKTLNKMDFIIHLCAHLYKEATTLPWIRMRRDMTLYKYVDLVYLFSNFSFQEKNRLYNRILELELRVPCYYAIKSCAILFNINNEHVKNLINDICPADTSFINEVIDPENKKTYRYISENLIERFFADNRISLLEEII